MKRVLDYASFAPESFQRLERLIDEVANTHTLRHGEPSSEALAHIQEEYLPKPGLMELMQAAAESDGARVRGLLALGVQVDATDGSGWTALMYAAGAYSNPEVISLLLNAGADPRHLSAHADTPLMAASLGGRFSKDLARVSDINAQNLDGVTAAMILAIRPQTGEIEAARAAGARADLRDQRGYTAEDYSKAYRKCHLSLIRGNWNFRRVPDEPCEYTDSRPPPK